MGMRPSAPALLLLACALMTGAVVPAAEEPPEPKPFFSVAAENRGAEIQLVGKLLDCLCVNLELTVELQNLRASTPLPLLRDITEPRTALTTIRLAEKSKRSNYSHAARFAVGRSGARPDWQFLYQLPFPVVARFRITQGYAGNFNHDPGSPYEFAVDWAMPEGTPVLAARAGTVVALRADRTASGPTDDFRDQANLVIVEHRDGTLAEYLHFRPRGLAVKLGQRVGVGDLLGFSGATGYTRAPQLQVRVYRIGRPGREESLPVRWHTRERYEAPTRPGALPFRFDPLAFVPQNPSRD